MLTHLVFANNLYEYLVGVGIENWYDVRNIINILLFRLQGPVTKFVLYIPDDKVLDVEDINNWVMFLSRKGVKEFILKNMHETTLKLSTCIFFCAELESLTLYNCSIRSPPTFCGFPNLLCLELRQVAFENGSLEDIMTQSTSLEILRFNPHVGIEKLKLVEIAKFNNLKQLLFPLCSLDHIAITSSSIVDLGSCLPNLKMLFLDFNNCQFSEDSVGRKCVSTSFPYLKGLTLNRIVFSCKANLMFAFELIRCTPNLQTLFITAKRNDVVPSPANFLSELNSIQLGLAQLRRVTLVSFQGSENEILLIKILLAGTPSLEEFSIHPESSEVFNADNGKLMVATKLLKFHRASPKAEVEIYWS
ncbi:F-box/FBD/LRR-repeat protein At1g13570-like [Rutidosis leptorrhynchoides]|uniref:F-box/FBD/LRR-repeat protein At1g13570-like n=1 Tax=Rutidosis leptorrhynchoides TaxID=125765 RepID=UPI003A9A2D6C